MAHIFGQWRRDGRLVLPALLLLALALRLALWAQPLHEPANDEREYIAVAYDLLAGRGWTFYDSYHWLRAPLYPLFLAGSLWLTGGNLHLAALPNLLLSVGLVALVYALTREILRARDPLRAERSRAPAVAGLLAALLWTQATFASLYMSETLFSFLLAAAFWLLIRWRHAPPGRLPRPALLVLAGLCFGLAVLTRSLALAFGPVVVLWLLGFGLNERGRLAGWRQLWPRLLAAGLFVAPVALTIAPWTLRNCRAYQSCILVETGFSYNMWAFNEPHESMSTIFRTLEQIPDPAARAEEATRRGLERLREDPAILWRKIGPNWDYFWRIKPIQDRFLMSTYYADPPPLVFVAALLFDDLLYVGILAASVVGLTARPARPPTERGPLLASPTVLLALWLAYVVVAIVLTHGESRYRHFVFPVLLPYAALGLAALWHRLRPGSQSPGGSPPLQRGALWAGRVALIGLLVWTVAQHYPWQWAGRGLLRSSYRLAGDIAYASGNRAAAEAAYLQALDIDDTADVALALGNLYLERGDLARAEAAYYDAWREERHYVAANARLGDVLRRQHRLDAARDAFVGFYVSEQAMLDWSWQHLAPPPDTHIDIGGGLDFGYVGGMYPDERLQGTTARWTSGRGLLRFAPPTEHAASTSGPAILRLRLAAPRPDPATPIIADICTGGRCVAAPLAPTWRTVEVLLPAGLPPGQVVEVRSPTFAAPDGRQPGVLIDRATLQQAHAP